jgi:hypothetical protein
MLVLVFWVVTLCGLSLKLVSLRLYHTDIANVCCSLSYYVYYIQLFCFKNCCK